MMQTINPEAVGLATARLQRLSAVMQRYVDENKLAGIVSLIARRGQIAHFEAFGQRDLATNRPMMQNSIFRIYSMTKPITSVAVLMLLEQNRLLLTDPISAYLPAFKNLQVFDGLDVVGHKVQPLAREITVHDLLTHQAGLSYGFYEDSPVEAMYREVDFRNPNRSVAQAIQALVTLPLLYQPGTAWRYSVATDVLGHLVELVSGQSLDQFFKTYIFEPLGMSETGFYVPEEKHDRLASVYEANPAGGIRRIDTAEVKRFEQPRPHLAGGGGLVSTTTDYWRFCQMLLNQGAFEGERVLSRKSVELMTQNHLPEARLPIRIGASSDLAGYGFGLGVRVLVNPAQAQMLGSVGEYGWGGMASTFFFVDPQEALIGILMTQFMPASYYPIRREFKNLVYQAIVD